MAKNLIGHMSCPECGHDGAEVGLDKSGHPYRVCILGECEGAQHFTHGKPGRVKNLLKRTRFVAGFDSASLAKKYGIELPAPAPAPQPGAGGGDDPARSESKDKGFGFFR